MSKKDEKKSGDSKINDGKCCRCQFYKNKMCWAKKSPKLGKYVARKGHCHEFKYND